MADVLTPKPSPFKWQAPKRAVRQLMSPWNRAAITAKPPLAPMRYWRGAALLQEAGIDVRVGLCEAEAREAHKVFFARVRG